MSAALTTPETERKKRPASQYYWGDWWKDKGLHSCSLTARGLWHEMNCLMHEGEPYGHLTLNGRPMTVAQLANQCRISASQCVKLLRELEDAGVPSRTADGVIFSRRMVRDEAARNARAEGGKAGGEHGSKGAEHGSKGGRPSPSKGAEHGSKGGRPSPSKGAEHGSKGGRPSPSKGAEHGSKGGSEAGVEGGLRTPLDGLEKPPPSSSSSSSSSSEAKASAAGAAARASPPDPRPRAVADPPSPEDRIFALGVPLLTAAGVAERNARSMLGMLRKRHGDEAVADAIDRCAALQVSEPVSWLQAALKPKPEAKTAQPGARRDIFAGLER